MPIFPVHADETYVVAPILPVSAERFTNANWFIFPHPQVATFTVLTDGSMHGSTVTGIEFVQYNVPNDLDIRVQRFEMQDHYHFIVEGEIANTFSELSILLAQAWEAKQGSV